MNQTYNLDGVSLQGHRGCRGLLPENTIPAFLHALELGVRTLELDIVICSDEAVLVSHEPYMSAETCLHPDGEMISKEQQMNWKVYQMTYAEAQSYECGMIFHPRFPRQTLCNSKKPLLHEVFAAVKDYEKKRHITGIQLNVEIKSTMEGDNLFHPEPAIFSQLLVDVLNRSDMRQSVTVQSFDERPLKYLHSMEPDLKLALLVEGDCDWEKQLKLLGFLPAIYSPEYTLVSEKMVKDLHDRNLKIIPWTVNDLYSMKLLLRMGVDGMISDYPDLYQFL